MGGEVGVESAEGKGSTFFCHLQPSLTPNPDPTLSPTLAQPQRLYSPGAARLHRLRRGAVHAPHPRAIGAARAREEASLRRQVELK